MTRLESPPPTSGPSPLAAQRAAWEQLWRILLAPRVPPVPADPEPGEEATDDGEGRREAA
jgi:hypothetical protein